VQSCFMQGLQPGAGSWKELCQQRNGGDAEAPSPSLCRTLETIHTNRLCSKSGKQQDTAMGVKRTHRMHHVRYRQSFVIGRARAALTLSKPELLYKYVHTTVSSASDSRRAGRVHAASPVAAAERPPFTRPHVFCISVQRLQPAVHLRSRQLAADDLLHGRVHATLMRTICRDRMMPSW
jgi:hypothetical protein